MPRPEMKPCPFCGTREVSSFAVVRVHDRVSDRERRDIVTALRNITFFEDDETGEERCEINDVIDALDVHTDVDWALGRDEVERLIDIVSVPHTGPRKYRLNADALRQLMVNRWYFDTIMQLNGIIWGLMP